MKTVLILSMILMTGCASRPVRFVATVLGGMGNGLSQTASHTKEVVCTGSTMGNNSIYRCK